MGIEYGYCNIRMIGFARRLLMILQLLNGFDWLITIIGLSIGLGEGNKLIAPITGNFYAMTLLLFVKVMFPACFFVLIKSVLRSKSHNFWKYSLLTKVAFSNILFCFIIMEWAMEIRRLWI